MSASAEITRRAALKIFAGGAAASLAGCSRPDEEILPYVDMPEGMTAGEPEYYATALALGGYARGVIVKALEGRPIKIAGNPRHPASLGATDIFGEAEIMALYDPDRSRTLGGPRPVAGWSEFFDELLGRIDMAKGSAAPLHILTATVSSPTLLRQIDDLTVQIPGTRWFAYDPTGATSRRPRSIPRLDKAKVIVSLDADPLGPGPMQVAFGRGFADGRHQAGKDMSRLYAIESTWTLTGANADHRLPLPPAAIGAVAKEVAARLGGKAAETADLPAKTRHFVDAMLADIRAAGAGALLLAGDTLAADAREAVDAANRTIGAPVDQLDRPDGEPVPDDFAAFLDALDAGEVENLLVLDCNPAYDAAPDADFAKRLRAVPFAAHAGCYDDETAALCRWRLPLSHPLEAWSDLRSLDGTASIAQPLIRPLYETRSAHEILAFYAGQPSPSGHDIVRATWRRDEADDSFENWWRSALVEGIVSGRAPKGLDAARSGVSARPRESPSPGAELNSRTGGLVAVIRPDPTIYDGRHANNAWLQECPKPLSKGTWTNVVSLTPEDAQSLSVADGDIVSVTSADGSIEGPVRIDRGQATGVVGLTLGYGRQSAGAIGNELGYNARMLAPAHLDALVIDVEVRRTGKRAPVPSSQEHFKLEGDLDKLLPEIAAGEALYRTQPDVKPSLFEPDAPSGPYSWGMVIDTAACTGCNACVIACQSENNVAVVGPDEVANGRIMHWLRIDRYELGGEEDVRQGFEPVPCMQCEKAPCEPVCPVEASVHDSEGLNVQVYNRCVGTRFCQSNCPYKVRRFNWFAYNSGQEYKSLGDDPAKARNNPDVTVRARGVMEKCTYCVQRISRARRESEKTDEPIPDGGVVTACQEACPTRAIHFGNLQDKGAEVSALRDDPRHFTLLEELGTRPRTTYLARVRNPNPALAGDGA